MRSCHWDILAALALRRGPRAPPYSVRMRNASVRDLFLGFEQLEVIRDLLLSSSPVKARMA